MNRITFCCLLVALSTMHCKSLKKQKALDHPVVQIKFHSRFEFMQPDSLTIYTFEDSNFISYYHEKVVMKLPVTKTRLKAVKRDSVFVLTETGEPGSIGYEYVLYNSGNSTGTLYHFASTKSTKVIKIDSVWKKRNSYPANLFGSNGDSLIGIRNQGGTRIESYINIRKPDDSYADSMHLFYSETLNHIPFSFFPDHDKKTKRKLFRIQLIYKSYFSERMSRQIPRREFLFEFEPVNVIKDEFLLNLLKKL